MLYEIRIKGVLDETWADWLGEVEMRCEDTDEGTVTTLSVDLSDQAALFGILDHIRDLNLTLLSVN